jgi:hypothetical protein
VTSRKGVPQGAKRRQLSAVEGHQRAVAPLRTSLYATTDTALRLRNRRVRSLARRVRERLPWIDESDEPTVRVWAELEILGASVFNELMSRGVVNDEGESRRLLDDYRRLRQTQLPYTRELGMSPRARAELSVDSSRTRALTAAAQIAEQRPKAPS